MIDIERLSNLCLDISTEWNDIQITYRNKTYKEKTITAPLIYTGSNGIYVFLGEQYKKDVVFIHQELEKMFEIRGDGLYLFFFAENSDVSPEMENDEDVQVPAWAYDSIGKTFIELTDLYDGFDIFYYNHYIPQSEMIYYSFKNFEDYFRIQEVEIEAEITEDDAEDFAKYVKPIISSAKIENIEKFLEEKLSSGIKKGKYTYYEDGTLTVKKIVQGPNKISNVLSSYMEDPKYYDYPCKDEDGNKTFLRTVLGGWFGLHKFKDRKFMNGLLYAISCGGCCMFYWIDVLSVMTGNYFTVSNHYFRNSVGKVDLAQTKTFNRPVENKKLFLLFPLMIAISLGLLKFAYLPMYVKGTEALSNITTSIVSQYMVEPSTKGIENNMTFGGNTYNFENEN